MGRIDVVRHILMQSGLAARDRDYRVSVALGAGASGMGYDRSFTLESAPEVDFFPVDLRQGAMEPYQALLPLLDRAFQGLDPEEAGELLQRNLVFPRQYPLWKRFLGDRLPPSAPGVTHEPPLPEEYHFEIQALDRTVRNLVSSGLDHRGRPLVLVVQGAEHLGPEVLRLLTQEAWWQGLGFGVLLLFATAPDTHGGDSPVMDFLRDRISRAQVVHLGDDDHDEPPPLAPLPGLADLWLLRDWFCFGTIQQLLQARHENSALTSLPGTIDTDEGLAQEFLYSLALEGLERMDQGVYHGERLLSSLQDRDADPRQVEAMLHLARLYRSLGDHERGYQLLDRAERLALDLGNHDLVMQVAMHIFMLDPRPQSPINTDPGFIHRLEIHFLERCWYNHAANILTRNVRVVAQFHREGGEAAMESLKRGLALARSQRNYRRLSVALHTLGTLNQLMGRNAEGLRAFRQATGLMLRWATPEQLARVKNATGYYHASLGLHGPAIVHYHEALDLVRDSLHFDQICACLINMAQTRLYQGEAALAFPVLEQVLLIMDRLGMDDLAYHPRGRIFWLLAWASIQSGEDLRALEIQKYMEGLPRIPEGGIYHTHISLLVAVYRRHGSEVRRLLAVIDELGAPELHYHRPILINAYMAALSLETMPGLESLGPQCLDRLTDLVLPLPYFPVENRVLQDHGRQRPQEPTSPHPEPSLQRPGTKSLRLPEPLGPRDYAQLLRQVDHKASLLRLQEALRESSFVQKWQDLMVQATEEESCVGQARALLLKTFLLDRVVLAGKDTDDFRQLLERFGPEPHFGMEGSRSYSHVPIFRGESLDYILYLEDRHRLRAIGPSLHRTLYLAGQQLGSALLSMGRKQELEHSNQALTQTLRSLQEAQAHLVQSEKLASLGGLVAGVAHEINTPLGVCISAITFLQGKAGQLRQRYQEGTLRRTDLSSFLDAVDEVVGVVLTNLGRADGLVQSFKQVGADRASEQRRIFNLKDYIAELLRSMGPKLREYQAECRVEGPGTLTVDSYPGAFSQILANLVLNALIHAFEGSTGERLITVTLHPPDGPEARCLVEVTDNGKGISADIQGKIFDPFFTTRRGRGGTGLGLHISHNLATHVLGGALLVRSKPGEGSTFTLALPPVAPQRDPQA